MQPRVGLRTRSFDVQSHFLLRLVCVLSLSSSIVTAYKMDNRYSPEHSSRSQARNKADRMLKNPAHKEAKELESFILEKRQEYWNGTKSPERDKHDDEGLDVDVSGRGKHGRFQWEVEEDKEWASPYLPGDRWIELPQNQHYDRRSWFSAFNDSQVTSLLHAGRKIQFVFSLSTGHCGTTTLSVPSSYQDNGYNASSCLFGFETLAQGVRDFTRRHPSRRAARAFVRRFYLPSLIGTTLAAGKSCFADFGHHTLFGHLLPALKRELKERMAVVRLRRARLDTAMSYAVKRKKDGPCGSRCVYCPCPEEQRSCLPVPVQLWRKFTVFMKFLWMIDEVECRWHYFQDDSMMARNTSNDRIHGEEGRVSKKLKGTQRKLPEEFEINWSSELNPYVVHLAQLMGFPKMSSKRKIEAAAASIHKSHVSKREKTMRSPQQNEAEDVAYRKLMKFTKPQIDALREVLS